MSREIGFRVWSKKYNKYFELSGLTYENGKIDGIIAISEIIDGMPILIFLEPEDVVLEQDTGLKDKNGKRICEGDVVRLYDRYVSAIIWQDDYCGFRWHNKVDGYCGLGKDNKEYYEVIGNIHENPELLGGEE